MPNGAFLQVQQRDGVPAKKKREGLMDRLSNSFSRTFGVGAGRREEAQKEVEYYYFYLRP